MIRNILIVSIILLFLLNSIAFSLVNRRGVWYEGWKLEPYREGIKGKLIRRYSDNFILDLGQNRLISRGTSPINRRLTWKNKMAIEDEAIENAIKNMIEGIEFLPVDDSSSYGEFVKRETLEKWVRKYMWVMHRRIFTMENKLRVTITIALKGKTGVLNLLNVEDLVKKVVLGEIPKNIYVSRSHTGLILIVSGLKFEPAICPKIEDEDGNEIFGLSRTGAKAAKRGIVQYVSSLTIARKTWRAGKNPLIIKAIDVQGRSPCKAIVSLKDGFRIRKANQNIGLLEDLKVVFVL